MKPSGKPGGFLFLASILLCDLPKGDCMKSKIVVLFVCVLLTACGMGKGSRHAGSEGVSNAAESTALINLLDQGQAREVQMASGLGYRLIAAIHPNVLPELNQIQDESEIGSLRLKFEDRIYQSQYSGAVVPTIRDRTENSKTAVYLLKTQGNTNLLYLAVKSDQLSKLESKTAKIQVKSNPKPYCSRVQIYLNQIEDGLAIPDQQAICNTSGECSAFIEFRLVGMKKAPFIFKAYAPQASFRCIENSVDYQTAETKTNQYQLKLIEVELFQEFAKTKAPLILKITK